MTKFVDKDELKSLWRILQRLQADVRENPDGWHWNPTEQEALMTVMDAVIDTERAHWLSVAKSDVPNDAYEAFKATQPS